MMRAHLALLIDHDPVRQGTSPSRRWRSRARSERVDVEMLALGLKGSPEERSAEVSNLATQ